MFKRRYKDTGVVLPNVDLMNKYFPINSLGVVEMLLVEYI